MANDIFTYREPGFESAYWNSMSAVLTRLDLEVPINTMTEEKSAALCQLTRLEHLMLSSEVVLAFTDEIVATIILELPLLDQLELSGFGPALIRLNCPKLKELILGSVFAMSFHGMPESIQDVKLVLFDGSIPLKDILPLHSAKLLESLTIVEEPGLITDTEMIQQLCFNGKLKHLEVGSEKFDELDGGFDGAAAGAFSVQAPWQGIPQTLQVVILQLSLDKGIPKILEQLPNLKTLSLMHTERNCMHLDRPLNPFLDMPRLEQLRLETYWQRGYVDGAGVLCNWTPAALRLLGLAEKRLKEIRMRVPGRSITLIY